MTCIFSKGELKADKLNPFNLVGKETLGPEGETFELEMCNLGELHFEFDWLILLGPNWLKHSSKDKWSCIVGGRVFFCLFNLSEQPKGRMQCNFDNTGIIFSFEMNRPRLKRALSGFFSLWNKSSASTPCANVQVAGYSIFATAQLCGFQKLGAELSCAWCSFNLVLKATQVCCCS